MEKPPIGGAQFLNQYKNKYKFDIVAILLQKWEDIIFEY